MLRARPTVEDPLRPFTTVSLGVAQFIACQKPLVAGFNVPASAVRFAHLGCNHFALEIIGVTADVKLTISTDFD